MRRETRTLEILERLIAFPTVSQDGNLDLIDWVQNFLREAGFDVERIWSPDRVKAGLFARIGPNIDGGICLSAHTDVVPVDGQDWTRPAFELTDDGPRVFGRGTTDMKGFLASALAMAEQAKDATLSEPLSLSISYDEEIGCVGIQQMMPKLGKLIGKPRAVIVGEPTKMQVATGHKGKTALKVTCHGQAGHSALAPEFVNAIHVAAGFINEVQQLQERLTVGARDDAFGIPYSTVHIGKIAGGRALNIVPDQVVLEIEFRHLVETPAREIRAALQAISQKLAQQFDRVQAIQIDETNSYPGLDTPVDSDVVGLVSGLAGGAEMTKVSFGTEAGFFAELGLNTVVIGPGDMARDGHKPDEGLDKSELAACDMMMTNILASLTE